MQFNVAQLLKDPIGSLRQYELVEDIGSLDPELLPLGPLVGDLDLLRIHSGVLVKADLSTALRVGCNRCLEPIAATVRFHIEESFRPLTEVRTGRYIAPDEFEGEEEALEDAALLINEQHILDISEVVRQAIWLALPMYPSCNWMGEGECPNLTKYRQEAGILAESSDEMARNDEEAVDPRWAALLALKNGENEE